MTPAYQRIRCAVCGVVCEQRRRAVRVGVDSHVALECIECEVVYVEPATRTGVQLERVESERNAALEAKCALLAASLRQADARTTELVQRVRQWNGDVVHDGPQSPELKAILAEYVANPEGG